MIEGSCTTAWNVAVSDRLITFGLGSMSSSISSSRSLHRGFNTKYAWLQYALKLRVGKKISFNLLDLTIVPQEWLLRAEVFNQEQSKIRVASKSLLQGLRNVEKNYENENSPRKAWENRDELLLKIQ